MSNNLNGIRELKPYIAKHGMVFAAILILSVFTAALSLLPIQIIGGIVDILSGNETYLSRVFAFAGDGVLGYVLIFAAIYLLSSGVSVVYGSICTHFSNRVIEDVRGDAFDWAVRSFKPYKEGMKESDVVSRLTGDVNSIMRALGGPLNGLLPVLLKLVGSFVILLLWNYYIAAAAVLLMPVIYFSSKWIAAKTKEIARLQREAEAELVGAVSDTLYNIPVVKAWRSERFESGAFHPHNHRMMGLAKVLQGKFDIYWALVYMCTAIGLIATLALSVNMVGAGTLTIGGIIVAYTYMNNVLSPLISLSRYRNDLSEADASIARVFSLRGGAVFANEKGCAAVAPTIVFDGVSVRCNDNNILAGISFELKPNETLVLTGESGEGKTTLLYALMGFAPIESGEITIDGVRLEDCGARFLDSVGTAFQESYIFDRSIKENIGYSRESIDEARIMDLARELKFDDVLLERGMDYIAGTRGNRLSGGERRRISIARAVYEKKRVYVFDEPTAELDDECQAAVMGLIKRLKESATLIISTHDEKLTAIADRVIDVGKYSKKA